MISGISFARCKDVRLILAKKNFFDTMKVLVYLESRSNKKSEGLYDMRKNERKMWKMRHFLRKFGTTCDLANAPKHRHPNFLCMNSTFEKSHKIAIKTVYFENLKTSPYNLFLKPKNRDLFVFEVMKLRNVSCKNWRNW